MPFSLNLHLIVVTIALVLWMVTLLDGEGDKD